MSSGDASGRPTTQTICRTLPLEMPPADGYTQSLVELSMRCSLMTLSTQHARSIAVILQNVQVRRNLLRFSAPCHHTTTQPPHHDYRHWPILNSDHRTQPGYPLSGRMINNPAPRPREQGIRNGQINRTKGVKQFLLSILIIPSQRVSTILVLLDLKEQVVLAMVHLQDEFLDICLQVLFLCVP